jgi:hypothetical protein
MELETLDVEEDIVEHPETGRAVRRVVNYVDVESQVEKQQLDSLVQELNDAADVLDQAQANVDRLESAVNRQKSVVARIGEIESTQSGLANGEDSTSSEVAYEDATAEASIL